jgi:hypothetical protein
VSTTCGGRWFEKAVVRRFFMEILKWHSTMLPCAAARSFALALRLLPHSMTALRNLKSPGPCSAPCAMRFFRPMPGASQAGRWRCKNWRRRLSPITVTPSSSPEDFLRALSAGSGTKGRGLNYRIAKGALHTNSTDVVLTYIFRPEEEEFPPYFDQALITRLAAEFTIPVTENTGRAETLYKIADVEFQRARQIDAQQDTPGKLENFSLIDARK